MRLHQLMLLIYFGFIYCTELPKWQYKSKNGFTEYCCKCHYNFLREDVIEECYLKNNQDHLFLSFCSCHLGNVPRCSKSVTICNRNINCTDNLAYKQCKVPFLNNATLTCNDSLQWQPSFQCPKECSNTINACNTSIRPNETVVGTEFTVIFFNSFVTFKCHDDQVWKTDFHCPYDKKTAASIFLVIILTVNILLLVPLLILCLISLKYKQILKYSVDNKFGQDEKQSVVITCSNRTCTTNELMCITNDSSDSGTNFKELTDICDENIEEGQQDHRNRLQPAVSANDGVDTSKVQESKSLLDLHSNMKDDRNYFLSKPIQDTCSIASFYVINITDAEDDDVCIAENIDYKSFSSPRL